MLRYILIPLLAFIPGSIALDMFTLKYNIKLSKLENIVLGCVIWNYVLICCGYIIGILSNFIKVFYIIFTMISLFLLLYRCYRILIENNIFKLHWKMNITKSIIFMSYLPSLLIIFILTISHTLFGEYDATFFYLPLANSIIKTGGLRYDYYHNTGLTTTKSPAMPIMYAWLKFLISNTEKYNVGVRIVPLAYILLTTLVVYLISREIFKDYNIAAIAARCFLSIPVVFAMVSNYSLYLDIPFTFLFFLCMFILLKIYSKETDSNFWWFMFGVVISLMLLVKDTSFLILPAFLVLTLIPFVQQQNNKLKILLIILLSFVFTGAYNFLFIWDIFHFSNDLITSFIIRQIPVFIIAALFILLLLKLSDSDYPIPPKKVLILLSILSIPVVLFLLRNVILFGAITSSFLPFNVDYINATVLMNRAIDLKKLTPGLFEGMRGDILFTSLNLGAAFLVPALLGLAVTLRSFAKKENVEKKHFIFLAFFLILLNLWSWAFRCGYKGPELRRIYYYSPLFAILIATGVHAVADYIKIRKSTILRYIIFDSLVFIYLWVYKFNILSIKIEQLGNLLVSLDIADAQMLLIFSFFFFISFYPLNLNIHKINIKKIGKILPLDIRSIVPLVLIISNLILIMPFSYVTISNLQESISYVPPHWENDLQEVISYINTQLNDNYTIVTCYALPIAYFTNHPVIELVRYEGIINLLSLNSNRQNLIDSFVEQNIRYLLFPKLEHSHYNYFKKLSKYVPILSTEFIVETPYILFYKEFSKFNLYKVITPDEIARARTLFENNWTPLNNYSTILYSKKGLTLQSTKTFFEVIADDNQDQFWGGYKANSSDELFLSSATTVKIYGDDSLILNVNGTNNMVINHIYEFSQDWNSFNSLSFYLYGANTSKNILFTFHTEIWQDYYYYSIQDDFVWWKNFSIPFNSFTHHGKPSWTNIKYIEILFGNRTAIYYLDKIRLKRDAIGLTSFIPPIVTNSFEVKIVFSIRCHSLQSPVRFTLTSYNGNRTLAWILVDGVNLITVPSDLVAEGALLKVFYSPSNVEEKLDIHYLGILSDTP